MTDVHNYEKKLKSATKLVEEDEELSENDRKVLLDLKEECFANGLSTSRVLRHLYNARKLAKWIETDLEEADKKEIKNVVGKIEKSDYAESTKRGYKVTLKKIYTMLEGELPDKVAWYSLNRNNDRVKLPEEILTKKDISAMINHASKPRNRAIVACLYESGCRIGEFLPLKIKNVEFDEKGAILLVDGKTGSRRVRIVSSVPYLKKWIDRHPERDDPEAFIWFSKMRGQRLSYNRVRSLLIKLKERAGLDKKVNPQNLRKTRATHLANHLTEAQMKEYFGWTRGSDMASVYVHLSGRDVDKALLEMHGIEEPEEDEENEELKPKDCPQCGETNPATNQFCSTCGTILDEEKADELIQKERKMETASGAMEQLMQDDEFKQFFTKKLQEIKQET